VLIYKVECLCVYLLPANAAPLRCTRRVRVIIFRISVVPRVLRYTTSLIALTDRGRRHWHWRHS